MSKKEKQNETLQQEPVVEEQDVKQEAAAEPEEPMRLVEVTG